MKISRHFWRYRWHGLCLSALASLTGIILFALLPKIYEASSQIYVSGSKIMQPMKSGNSTGRTSFTLLDLMEETSAARKLFQPVAQTAGANRSSSNGGLDQIFQRIQVDTASNWENLYRLSFADTDRRVALAVLESVNAKFDEEAKGNSVSVESGNLTTGNAANLPEFRVVDPPTVGSKPISPKKSSWLGAILLAGLGSGAALAWLLSRRNKVFDDTESIPSIAGVPVIGSVSHAWLTAAQALRRRESIKFTGGVVCLLLFSGLILII